MINKLSYDEACATIFAQWFTYEEQFIVGDRVSSSKEAAAKALLAGSIRRGNAV